MTNWSEPTHLHYWEGSVDWRCWERADLPTHSGEAVVSFQRGSTFIMKRVNRIPSKASSIEEANCLLFKDNYYLLRRKGEIKHFLSQCLQSEIEKVSRAAEVASAAGNEDIAIWRRSFVELLQEKKNILEALRPGALNYVFFAMMNRWEVVYSQHSEDDHIEELDDIIAQIKNHPPFPRKCEGLGNYDDLLGDRFF
jgi:hypothetical protein